MIEKLQKKLFFIGKIISIFLLSILIGLSFHVPTALAHRPHDVIGKIELSPTYQQDQTAFILVRGNIFKSTDGGNTWTRLVNGLDNQWFLSSLTLSKQNSQTLFLSSKDGVYKSKDGGDSWVKVNNGLKDPKINLIAISPKSDELVLATGVEKGLYKTNNGGENWQQVFDKNLITAIGFSSQNQSQIIIGDRQGNLYVSQDEGDSWQKKFTIENSGSITTIALSPNFDKDNTIFVGTEKGGIFQTLDGGSSFSPINQGPSDKSIQDIVILPNSQNNQPELTLFASTWNDGFFESNDGGKTWKKSSQGLTKDSQADEPQFKVPHFTDLAVSQGYNQDKTLFLAGFNGLFKSTDGSRNWQEIETLSKGTITSLEISPNYEKDSTLAFVTYVGNIYITQDKGVTWKTINKGLEVPRLQGDFEDPHQDPRRFFDIAFSPNYGSDRTLFASLLWNQLARTTNGGDNWQIITLPQKGIRGIYITPSPNFASDKTVYLANQKGIIFKSTNGGETFTEISKISPIAGNYSPSLAISPDFASDKTLYASSGEGIYKTVDAGSTWERVTDGNPSLKKQGNFQLAISPNYKVDQTVWLATSQGIFLTKDGGKTWEKIVSSEAIKEGYVEGIAISPNYQKDGTVMVSLRGKGLYKTTDAGTTFTQIGDSSIALEKMNYLPSAGKPIQFSPAYATDKTIYGFGSARTEVYKSTDGGNTWQIIKVPVAKEEPYDLMTSISLFFYVYKPIVAFVVAAMAALLSYFLLGLTKLEKQLPLKRWQVKAGGAFIVFLVLVILLAR